MMIEDNAETLLQWVQQIMKDTEDIRNQVIGMRAEVKHATDELRTMESRVEQKDDEALKLIETLRSQVESLKAEIATTKSSVDSHSSDLGSKIDNVKSAVNEVRIIARAKR